MKAFLLSLSLLLTVSTVQAQFVASTLHLKNGEVKKGLVDNPKPDAKTVKFKPTETGTVTEYKTDQVARITFTSGKETLKLENIKPKGSKKSLLMQKMIEGPVNLYVVQIAGGQVGAVNYYLVKRDNEEEATTYNGLGFKKRVSAYLQDDPAVVNYIQETPLLDIDMFEVINRYNANKKKK
ncbi:hypothetical protein [Nibribacter koreensis]|uniref:DUF4412 domain-containing protein n=1 Tax=Nibribacter koreensis TaxID=1084519 RepID=A0ABP8FU41_9BACT